MVAGNTRGKLDLPPFFMYAGHDARPVGVNVVGLKRAGFSLAQVTQIKKAYRVLYRSGLALEAALGKIESELADENTLHLVRFARNSRRGICREGNRSLTVAAP